LLRGIKKPRAGAWPGESSRMLSELKDRLGKSVSRKRSDDALKVEITNDAVIADIVDDKYAIFVDFEGLLAVEARYRS